VKWTFHELNQWTRHYNEELLNGKWRYFFNWQPYHWFRSEKIEQPVCTPELFTQTQQALPASFLPVGDVLSANGLTIQSETACDIPLWINALTPIRHFSKAAADNLFCHVTTDNDSFDASATPINNVWHAPYVGPMWSRVGTLHLRKGTNRIAITDVKPDARIDQIFIGLWPPFTQEPRLRINASNYYQVHDSREGSITTIQGLGFHDGVLVQPFNTPSYDVANLSVAPFVSYKLNLSAGDKCIEIRALPTLHVYEGRDVRYAVQLGNEKPVVFSIHADDFCAEWRWNVLRGYSSRSIPIPADLRGSQELKVYFLDPGVVLQEIACRETSYILFQSFYYLFQ
ncbi:MAG: hypothetical protein K6G32_11825, partial [Prevotella sp.]|nr:hypothetical protein [Prevotella sp.]